MSEVLQAEIEEGQESTIRYPDIAKSRFYIQQLLADIEECATSVDYREWGVRILCDWELLGASDEYESG